ncbi:hypothetical protein [Streptomyces sp. NPDC087297]|uniref:hypothetical protein n=1 Tax=Streptomyces sp. NPDC087297 TaxID=3365778 RepID=UPI003805C8DC
MRSVKRCWRAVRGHRGGAGSFWAQAPGSSAKDVALVLLGPEGRRLVLALIEPDTF